MSQILKGDGSFDYFVEYRLGHGWGWGGWSLGGKLVSGNWEAIAIVSSLRTRW